MAATVALDPFVRLQQTNQLRQSFDPLLRLRASSFRRRSSPYKPSTLPRIPLRLRAIQRLSPLSLWTTLLGNRWRVTRASTFLSKGLRISRRGERARPDIVVAKRERGNEKDGIGTAGISIEALLAVRDSRQTRSVEYRSLRKASKETKRESTRKGRQMGRSSCTVRT